MFMIEPLRAFNIGLITAFVKLKTDFKFTRMTSSHCSSLMRMSKVSRVIPALFTKMSTVPNSATTSSTNVCAALKSEASLLYPFAFTPFAASSASNARAFSSDDA